MCRRLQLILTAGLVLSVVGGCLPQNRNAQTTIARKKATTNNSMTTATTDDGGEPAAKELEPFNAPPLAELDRTADWQPSLVVDSIDRLRKFKAENEKPTIEIAAALQMRNTNDKTNKDILLTLGQVPAEDGGNVDYDAILKRSLTMDIGTVNPILTSSVADSDYHGLTGANLFSFDWKMVPYADGDYVKEWYTSEDGLMDKIVMRDDLTWSDGQPLNAHDIVFSFKTILDPEIPVRAVRQGTDDIRWVEAYDDYTLVYFHKDSYATNVWNLNFPIIPRHVFEDSIDDDKQLRTHPNHQAYEENPVTGGPYEVVTRQRSQGIRLRRRDSFYMHNGEQVRHKPYFREVIFTVIPEQNTRLLALETGEIDEGELGAEEWRTKTSSARFYANNTKVRDKDWTYFYVGWNQTSPFFEDKKVRQALALVMSHEEMLEDLCYGLFQPSSGIFHPDSWMYPKDPSQPLDRFNKQDLDKADKMLDAAGWDDSDGDGVRDKMVNGRLLQFEFNLIVKNAPDRVAICTLYSEFLDKVSIKCNVRPLEGATLIDRIYEKKFQAVYAGWGSGADPSTNENIFGTGKDRNSGSYSNKEVDRLFDEAMLTHDREERAKLYAKIHELIYEDQPYMFLYTRSSFYGFNKKIRGYKFSPRGPYHYGPGIMSLWGQAD